MKGLLLFAGESFRLGGQNSRDIGSDESFELQMTASRSHVALINHIKQVYGVDMHVYLASYPTRFTEYLKGAYSDHMIGSMFLEDRIGLTALLKESVKQISTLDEYAFVCLIRIDLCLKEQFLHVFNPTWQTIRFTCICWHHCFRSEIHPRINDTMLFIPHKYYRYINDIQFCHESWLFLMNDTDLTYNDLDLMIDTFHDSDSEKDWNPIYYMVSRPENKTYHSRGMLFDKSGFGY